MEVFVIWAWFWRILVPISPQGCPGRPPGVPRARTDSLPSIWIAPTAPGNSQARKQAGDRPEPTQILWNPGFSLCHPIREILKDFLKIPICGPHVFLSNHIQPPRACDPTCGITSYYTYKKLLSFTFLKIFFIFAKIFSKFSFFFLTKMKKKNKNLKLRSF